MEWAEIGRQFKELQEKESQSFARDGNARMHAVGSYEGFGECGRWTLVATDEAIREEFDLIATMAGVEVCRINGVQPTRCWLHTLYQHLRRQNSKFLFGATETGGIIERVVQASAMYCDVRQRDQIEQNRFGLQEHMRLSVERVLLDAEAEAQLTPEQARLEILSQHRQARINEQAKFEYDVEKQKAALHRKDEPTEIIDEVFQDADEGARPALESAAVSTKAKSRGTIHSPAAVERMNAHLEHHGLSLAEFAIAAQTTDRTLRSFRASGRIRRSIFDQVAAAMGITREDLLKPGK